MAQAPRSATLKGGRTWGRGIGDAKLVALTEALRGRRGGASRSSKNGNQRSRLD